MEDDLKKKKK
jgi:hypothetical protein